MLHKRLGVGLGARGPPLVLGGVAALGARLQPADVAVGGWGERARGLDEEEHDVVALAALRVVVVAAVRVDSAGARRVVPVAGTTTRLDTDDAPRGVQLIAGLEKPCPRETVCGFFQIWG